MAAFAFGLGSFNTLSTLIEQLTSPYGFTQKDASNFGALVVFSGLLGAPWTFPGTLGRVLPGA